MEVYVSVAGSVYLAQMSLIGGKAEVFLVGGVFRGVPEAAISVPAVCGRT